MNHFVQTFSKPSIDIHYWDKAALREMKILIVEDQEAQTLILKTILRHEGFTQITTEDDARRALEVAERLQPDLLMLDLNMPYMSGFEVMTQLRGELGDAFPILVLTADDRDTTKQQALGSGAKDFLAKPFNSAEVVLRTYNLLESRRFHQRLEQDNGTLERVVKERTRQLEGAQVELLVRLARVAEYREDKGGEHVWRVAQLAAQLATELGLPRPQVDLLQSAARLHDIGKSAIPDAVLLKPGPLTKLEFEIIKTHTTAGAQLLSGGQSPILKLAESIALTHHERFDGAGYPEGLQGETIPLGGRIVALADSFDALTHDRVYRPAQSLEAAVETIRSESGKQFDPAVVRAFLRLYERGEVLSAPPTSTVHT